MIKMERGGFYRPFFIGVFQMALNYDLFRKVVAPEFASMSDEDLDLFAAEAECEVAQSKWGCRYDRAIALITAHLIAMSQRASGMGGNAATGELKKVKVGDLEREFQSSSSDSSDSYGLTTYGKEFLRIRKQILKGPVFVSC
jgi:hypothetical protein